MPPTDLVPAAALIVCEQRGEAYYEAKFRYGGRQVKRRIGRAWLTRDDAGSWRPRRGRVADGYLDERRAHVAAAEFVRSYVKDFNESERVERERRELVRLEYVEQLRSPLSAIDGEALGYVSYFAELIDEWAQEADPNETLFRLGASMTEAIADLVRR